MKPMLVLCALAAGVCAQDVVWAPKPLKLSGYDGPHRPVTRIAEVKAKHSGQADWRQVVVDDDQLRAEWISMAPGAKVSRRFHPDTREWWVVMDGQIRFDIEGQEPFIAKKGWMVQVPMQTMYSMETVGDKPSLRFEVNIAHARTLYAKESQPPELPGFQWIPVQMMRRKGVWGHNNKPHVTFEQAAEDFEKGRVRGTYRIVEDDRGAANFIYGYESKLPPLNPKDRGHYHPESCEFWLIMAGQIRYPIEGQGVIIANVGDVVYVPRFTFHAPRFYGPGPSCRLAMNGYPDIAHLFEVKDGK